MKQIFNVFKSKFTINEAQPELWQIKSYILRNQECLILDLVEKFKINELHAKNLLNIMERRGAIAKHNRYLSFSKKGGLKCSVSCSQKVICHKKDCK